MHWPQKLARLAGLVAALLCAVPAFAQGSVSDALESRLTALINTGAYDAAREELAAVSDDRADRLLLEGRILKAEGALDQAIDLLKDALRLRPGDLIIRRELAHTLFLNGSYGEASYHLDRLRTDDPDPQLRAAYRELQRQVDEQRLVTWDTFFSIEPSTNINQGSKRTHFSTVLGELEIDNTSRSRSGIGLRAGLGVSFNRTLDQQNRVSVRLSYETKRYSEDRTLDSGNTQIKATHVHAHDRRRIAWSSQGWHEKRNDGDTNSGVGLSFALDRQIAPRALLNFVTEVNYREYLAASSKSGWEGFTAFGAQHVLSNDRRFSYGIWLERKHPDAGHLRYDGYGVYLRAEQHWPSGLSLGGDLTLGWRDFDDVFLLQTKPRRDRLGSIGVTARLTTLHVRGFTPTLRCSQTLNRSNIDLFTYDIAECKIRVSRRF